MVQACVTESFNAPIFPSQQAKPFNVIHSQTAHSCKGPRRIISVRHSKLCKYPVCHGGVIIWASVFSSQDEEDELSRSGKQVVAWSAVCGVHSGTVTVGGLAFIDDGVIVDIEMAPTAKSSESLWSWGLCS